MNYACTHHEKAAKEYCLLCFRDHPVMQELRDLREANEAQPASPHCTAVTVGLGRAMEKIAELEVIATAEIGG